jgi:hypothetical protein
MEPLPRSARSIATEKLLEEEHRLAEEAGRLEDSLSGLKDLDLVLGLAGIRLSICIALLQEIGLESDPSSRTRISEQITERALSALRLVEGLVAENVSEDQRGIVQADARYAEVRAKLEEFLIAGGGGFLETRQSDARKSRTLSRGIVAAIRKYSGEDDRYPPLELEKYPQFVRSALLFLFPVFMREHPELPPYGIEEGEEVTYSSRTMQLPLSQAIEYIERELLPELERKLAEDPGSNALQKEIARQRERAEDYRKLKFFPRSTPVLLEKGYYTEGMTGYTADGEMLVPIALPVSFKSGTNLDRKMEMVRMDVVRRIAGRGVSEEIDREYGRLRSVQSGIRGNSRTPSMRLDPVWGYRALRQEFPFLRRLADKAGFQELVDLVQRRSIGAAERRIAALIEADQETRELPLALDKLL